MFKIVTEDVLNLANEYIHTHVDYSLIDNLVNDYKFLVNKIQWIVNELSNFDVPVISLTKLNLPFILITF